MTDTKAAPPVPEAWSRAAPISPVASEDERASDARPRIASTWGKSEMAEQIGSDVDQARAWAARSIAELRAAHERSLNLGQEVLANWESLTVQGLLGLREISERLRRNLDVNVLAIFDLAEKHVQARSASEMFELQRQFLEEQSERLADQVKDIENLVSAHMRALNDEIGREPRG